LEGVGGPGIDEANALGMFVGTGALCAATLILSERSWRRWTCVALMPFILNTLIQSESRGAMLAVVAGALVLFYLRPPSYRLKFYAFAAVGVVLFGYLAQDVFWERMSTLRATVDETEELDGSAESRLALASAQWQMFRRYPLGSGHRGTAELSVRYLDEKWLTRGPLGTSARSSHSTLLSALVEQGVPGILIFTALFGWVFVMTRALKRKANADGQIDERQLLYGSAASGSLALVFVAGLFTDYIKTEVQIWMLAILASVLFVHVPHARSKASEAGTPPAEPSVRVRHAHPQQRV
jgi:O-antigen ligase